eukprot:TRINITY_DN11625_c0_g1_i3.p5 TRINITY_DN11625_c0_g1~~TRINITY_DN11625_c0_g1_i3.p5  ORF type:complete len:109 (+),score=15.58 TRINITY_DN11625_c0_g1_i3:1937-2263(+)
MARQQPPDWSGEINLKRWEMPSLCKFLMSGDCHLQQLRLDGNRLTNQAAEQLANALSINTSVRQLDFSGANLSSVAIIKLVKATSARSNISGIRYSLIVLLEYADVYS